LSGRLELWFEILFDLTKLLTLAATSTVFGYRRLFGPRRLYDRSTSNREHFPRPLSTAKDGPQRSFGVALIAILKILLAWISTQEPSVAR
jgi:hypothetical protein